MLYRCLLLKFPENEVLLSHSNFPALNSFIYKTICPICLSPASQLQKRPYSAASSLSATRLGKKWKQFKTLFWHFSLNVGVFHHWFFRFCTANFETSNNTGYFFHPTPRILFFVKSLNYVSKSALEIH